QNVFFFFFFKSTTLVFSKHLICFVINAFRYLQIMSLDIACQMILLLALNDNTKYHIQQQLFSNTFIKTKHGQAEAHTCMHVSIYVREDKIIKLASVNIFDIPNRDFKDQLEGRVTKTTDKMGRWGRHSPVLEPPDPPPPSPPPLPQRAFMRQSSFTKIGNMLNTAININSVKKPHGKFFTVNESNFFLLCFS
uniref:Uncharacterized protein n=1 Tax=Glossina palpalis gambiensis TaxID=67801 RepID=A0A1B0BWG3_9MUSC